MKSQTKHLDKFAFITDSHFTSGKLEARTDDYVAALFQKLDFVVEFCKKHNIKHVIHGGDLFNVPVITDLVAGKIARVFAKSRLQLWCIIGNHDITGKNASTYVNGKLHMFESYDWFHFIGGKVVEFENCVLTGEDFSYENELSVDYNLKRLEGIDKTKILVLHAMIFGEEKDFKVKNKRIIVSYTSIDTNADLVLCGHYHPGMEVKKLEVLNKDILFANPGSLGRTDKLTNKVGIGPGLTYVVVGKHGFKTVKNVAIPCDRKVFIDKDDGKYELANISGAKFYSSIKKLKKFRVLNKDIGMMLRAMSTVENETIPFEIDDDIIEFIVTKVREVDNGNKIC